MKGKKMKKKGNAYGDSVSWSEVIGGGSSSFVEESSVDLIADSLDFNDDGEAMDDLVACSEEGDDDGVEFLGYDDWGRKKLKTGGENFKNAIPIIEVVSSDDDEVEVIGESGSWSNVNDLQSDVSGELESSSNDDSDELQEVSSDEDNDDSDDEDFRVRDQRLEQAAPSESEGREDGGGSNVTKRGSNNEEGKEKEAVVVGSKRRKTYGPPDVLVDCVARHTRSRFGSKINEPNRVDDDDDGDDPKHQANKHSEKKFNSRKGNADQEELGKSTERKRGRAPKKLDFVKILLDSILNNGIVEESISSRGGRNLDQETSPPPLLATWKFLFPVKDSNNPTEDSEEEEEEENKLLWMELDFVLRSSEIDSTDSFTMDNEDFVTPDDKSDPASLCSRGIHRLIINEEVGLICKFCSFVDLEMKYISPSFDKQDWRRLQNKDYGERETEYYTFNELKFQDSGCGSQLGCDPHGTVWEIIPGIKKSMYRHQREGFEFIWKIIAGGIFLHELKKKPSNFNGGGGCVISHAPGTGKTRLILAFLQAYMEIYPTCKPMIIAPRSMLLTWEEQCKIWNFPMPLHSLNNNELSGKENMAVLKLLKEVKHHDRSVDINRMAKIYSWVQGKSILGLSYRLFERLVWKGEEVGDKKKCTKIVPSADSEIRKILLELPGLLVLDEGHTPRNDQSLIWKAMSKIQTEKRIILSGTPFQNNFDELYNTLCVVRPKFADTVLNQSRGLNDFQRHGRKVNDAARGKWASLTNSIIGKDAVDDRLYELRAMIDPFVHVHKGNILQESLPGLRDSVVVLQPTDFQKSLLEGIQGMKNTLELGHMVSLISAHPSLLLVCPSEKEKSITEKNKLKRLRLNPDAGVKTKFLMELIKLSEAMNEKVLVFSQYIHPLTLIRDQLKSHFNWFEGKEVLYMDGKRDVKQRQSSINVFNEMSSEARVLLASTRACSEGINLIGASRVVLLDVVWNPSVERQAISRAYRLGQKRIVYIYHLITSGTIEGDKYCRQTDKERISELVFSSTTTQNDCNGQKISDTVSVSDDKILEEMVQHDKLKYLFEKIIFQPKESDLIETFRWYVSNYF